MDIGNRLKSIFVIIRKQYFHMGIVLNVTKKNVKQLEVLIQSELNKFKNGFNL